MYSATPVGRVLSCSVIALVLVAFGLSSAYAGVGDYNVSDPSKVYMGNSRLFQRPACVDCDRIYSHIPEYQEILRRGLTDQSPAYHLLMKKASQRFSTAVKKMAAAENHDLVAHLGVVTKAKAEAPDVPDRTDEVVRALD